MFNSSEDIKFAFIIGFLILGTFVIFIISFILLYKKRQNALLIAQQLKETELENVVLKKEMETLKAIQDERGRIGGDLHDDLGPRLSAIRMELEFLQKTFDTEADKIKVAKVVEQSGQLSGIVREIVWSLNSQYDTLDSFANYLKVYASNFLSRSPIELQTEFQENLPETEMSSSVRRSLFLAIKEALNNAVRHSEASALLLKLSMNAQQLLEVSIIDNGRGVVQQNEFGNGLYNMKNRLDKMSGKFSIGNAASGGTQVDFSLKL